MPEETNYSKKAAEDALETVENFMDEIVDQLFDKGEASDDLLNDYDGGDEWHHSNHVDRSYSLLEAAQLLDQLSEHEETDWGLWEGLPQEEPERMVEVKAAYTYGNAVYAEWRNLISSMNDEAGHIAEEMHDKRISEVSELQAQLFTLNAESEEYREVEENIEQLSDDDAFENKVKRMIRREAESAAGIKKKGPQGPKEWRP